MTPQDHVGKCFSQYEDTQLKYKTKVELLGNLKSAGVDIFVLKGKRVGEMQDISCKK